MVEGLFDRVWAGPLLWAAVYVSDYVMTLTVARMYQAQRTIVFEGSYELTPMFQADINALRRFSPRFVKALVSGVAYLVIAHYVSYAFDSEVAYAAVLGAMLLLEATVHLRHVRNWFLFRNVASLQGGVSYPRTLLLRSSALELLGFAVLYLVIFFLTDSMFVLGGALSCGVLSVNHYRLAQRHLAAAPSNASVTSA